ncbi:MAG: hypothetical protein A2015_13800 [Spirochaetes bacterium GWF1_31_7]|nr:MAG: hypothetical protein A2Y30_11025 [Spirochaetes bacterium GWE1_32_154]OHD46150.1 MAG: hypothetical protein A2Y29_08595 [Spirochaetes bacterium GWE2_31_10]OHD49891.1 MAG: hypothetical protein A2015_13800 [Spirochaetes bacterium GWF1_31_7]OHD78897.1 MAG: hypothetical protein A2355_01540 [Spirochaetes bacterium RIFOXYB1_FULL_32_8]HBD96279.1 hypothetical protein [Spirochaetia bacterium]
MRKTGLLLIGIQCLLLLSSCNKKVNEIFFIENNNSPYSIPDRKRNIYNENKKKQLVTEIVEPLVTLNPFSASTQSDIFVRNATMGALVYVSHRYGDVYPFLCDYFKVSDNQLDYDFTIPGNLKFSDGSPLTIDDVVESFNLLNTILKDSNIYFRFVSRSNSVTITKINHETIRLSLKKIDDNFLFNLTHYSIVKRDELLSLTDKISFYNTIQFTSAGPYVIKNKQESFIVLARNHYYHRKSNSGNVRPYTDEIKVNLTKNRDSTVESISFQELDFIMYKNVNTTGLLLNNPGKNYRIIRCDMNDSTIEPQLLLITNYAISNIYYNPALSAWPDLDTLENCLVAGSLKNLIYK